MVGNDSTATRIAYFWSLLSYRSMLMTTLARMRALRSFHSDVTTAEKNVDCSESLSLKADISLAVKDLHIVDNEVRRVTQYEAYLLDKKRQQLVSHADSQTVLSAFDPAAATPLSMNLPENFKIPLVSKSPSVIPLSFSLLSSCYFSILFH